MIDMYYLIPAALVLLATPGPTNMLLWASGASVGVRQSLALLPGELVGYFSAIAVITIILGPVIAAVPILERLFALTAAIYICWLAVVLWRKPKQSSHDATTIRPQQVFLVTLLNPKAFIFAFTILPVRQEKLPGHYLALAGCILLAGFCWIVFGHLVGTASGPRRAILIHRLSSAALALFAGWITFSAFGST